MHLSSELIMQRFAAKYLVAGKPLQILDIGSYAVNGSYKATFMKPGWRYVGLDIEAGPNVDIVATDVYKWPVPDDSYDVVISGQCLEHVPAPWLWIKEVARVCKKGGLVAVIAPWSFIQHRHPVDCWRILPDGMKYLLSDWAGLEVLEVSTDVDLQKSCDCFGFGRKRG